MVANSFRSINSLKAVGAYHILVDPSQGGLGGSLLEWFDMAVTLAEADASTGWVVGHRAVYSGLVANIAEPSFAARVFSDPMSSIAWSNLPRVRSEIVDDGLSISGRGAFETGCMSATFIGGMLPDPRVSNGQPMEMIVALTSVENAIIEETWDLMGLLGTGSHEVVFEDVFVPWEQIFRWPDSRVKTNLPTSVFAPGTWFISICAAATHLGLARRTIDEARNELNGNCYSV